MSRVAMILILGLAAAGWPRPVTAQYAQSDPCTTTEIDSVSRLADDSKGRRYLVGFHDAARSSARGGTFRLDTDNAHIVVPFDGTTMIVRAPLDHDVVAAAIASVHAYGRDIACALHPRLVQPGDFVSDAAVVPHTRTFDAIPVADAPVTCEHPFVEGGADHSVAVEAPPIARHQGITGIVVVSVTVDDNGRPSTTRIVSSPSAILNAAALAAAQTMTYTPSIYRCVRSPQSQVLFRADFMPRR